jgi:hypothetical protein
MQRDERKEQEELAGKKKAEAAQSKSAKALMIREKLNEIEIRPRRTARPGKPMRR